MVSEPTIARLVPLLGNGIDDEETLGGRRGSFGGPIIGIHEKRRGEPKKNGEINWVKLPNVTPLTEPPAQCHTPNDGIPSRTSVFETRWFVISQMTNPTSKREKDSNQYIRLRALSPH